MIVLYILLGIIALITLLLMIPVSAELKSADGKFTLSAGYGFITLDVLKLKERFGKKKEKPKDTEKKAEAQSEQKKTKEKKDELKSLSEKIEDITSFINAAKPAVMFILKRIVLVKLNADILVADEDAHKTALAYGKTHAACASFYALLKNIFKIKECRVNITPDFTSEKSRVGYDVKVSLRPIFVLGALAIFFKEYIKSQTQKA